MLGLTPHTDSHLRTNHTVAVEHVDTTWHTVVVDVVLANDTHRDAVMNLARSHVHALRHEQVGGSERDGVFVVHQVLSVLTTRSTNEHDVLAVAWEANHRSQGLACRVHRGNRDVAFAGAAQSHVSQSDELEQRAGGFTGLGVNCVAVSDREDVAALIVSAFPAPVIEMVVAPSTVTAAEVEPPVASRVPQVNCLID